MVVGRVAWASACGVLLRRIRSTNSSLIEAIGLYQAAGYREVVAFNNEPYADHWFEKTLDHSTFPDAEPA